MFLKKTDTEQKIQAYIMWSKGSAERALEFEAETDKLLWIEHNVLDLLDLPGINTDAGEAAAEYAEKTLESRLASIFRCACGQPTMISCYMADGAIETETSCACGRSSYNYRGYHDRGPGPTKAEIAAEHNASNPKGS